MPMRNLQDLDVPLVTQRLQKNLDATFVVQQKLPLSILHGESMSHTPTVTNLRGYSKLN